ncbi:metalloprotease family protein [Natranaeroarchaeum aerophilus]|uniref:Metalloprotease family protein n=1 Tax=Natranaeroarchaeum aerophilus TaxID=2917711 RepID=A0AAE3K6I7_9EURY|nr:metalloprotease family protein [Natranaeroarchaeum aerophilus]MCL9815023.1 metalloprotease family protein [Natranaeroarchaeum aerophilus]
MSLIGWVLTIVTAPGVVVHEYTHAKLCEWADVPIVEICYFQLGDPPGYVLHAEPESYRTTYLIGVAPFLVNTLVAAALFATIPLLAGGAGGISDTGIAGWIVLWLGVSVAAHAFPSTGDAQSIWQQTKQQYRSSPLALIGLPIVLIIYLAHVLSFFWFDFIYALALYVGVAMVLPGLIL